MAFAGAAACSSGDDDNPAKGGSAGSAGVPNTIGSGGTGGLAGTGGITGSGAAGGSAGAGATGGSGGAGGAPDAGSACDGFDGGAVGNDGGLETEAQLTALGPYPVQSFEGGGTANYKSTTVYYPGCGTRGPFPVIAMSPGWQEGKDIFEHWGTFLASHGFVAAAYTPNDLNDLPTVRATSLGALLDSVKTENTRNGSPLKGKLDTSKLVVMGHSMGGGGTIVAASQIPSLKAVIALCPWLPAPIPDDKVPTLIFGADNDPLAPLHTPEPSGPPTNGLLIYNTITPSKTLVQFSGTGFGQHFVANDPLLENHTLFPASPSSARIALAWLRIFVNGDKRYEQYLTKDADMTDFKKSLKP
jgi:pimeloyl-ACP methyl ester carboxylesterase